MHGAPELTYNTEVWFKPRFAKGLRIGAEVQHVGEYFADPKNISKYEGYTTLNLRVGYEFKAMELWINALNVTDNYYANFVNKSAFGYSYNLADPRSINVGFSYDFGHLFTQKQ
jgi:outer membrane receptor protein involved in Fe transport